MPRADRVISQGVHRTPAKGVETKDKVGNNTGEEAGEEGARDSGERRQVDQVRIPELRPMRS